MRIEVKVKQSRAREKEREGIFSTSHADNNVPVKPLFASSPAVPLWPSECWRRTPGWCRAGCWSGPSPAPAPCSCSDCSWWGIASSLPPSQSLQAACSGCQLPHQRPCHLRIWRLRLKSGTDHRHRATEDGWDGEQGLVWRFIVFWRNDPLLSLSDYATRFLGLFGSHH